LSDASQTRAIFVHGNPETAAIWGPLFTELRHPDAVTLSPPGFGAPVPDGFGATSNDYASWLVSELERQGAPTDLVGHDWGGGHVLNAVMHRPELVRSWVSDVVGLFDPDYVWHDLAQVWQTPGDGEKLVDTMMGVSLEEQAERLVGLGMTPEVATKVAGGAGAEMGRAILLLYRSARQPAIAQAGRDLEKAAARPGLSVLATEDHYVGSAAIRRRAAERAGARTEVLEGLGHWWMVQDPALGAAVLTRFWDSLD
jgi:pimeloyl-ACP methyl ester carboxylesterase